MSGFPRSTRSHRRRVVAAAVDADGRLLAPAAWTVVDGRTLSLEPAARGDDPRPLLLLPGLVNAHAHLDLGAGASIASTGSFPDWLLAVGRVRRTAEDPTAAAASVAERLGAGGVTAVGDIDGSRGAGTRGRRRAGLRGRSHLEIVGVDEPTARARLVQALERIDRLGSGRRTLGLSPHAPYSVHHAVVPEIVRAARRRGLPLAVHLAETPEETRYLLRGDGPFVAFLESIGRGAPFASAPGVRPVRWAEATGLLPAGAVVVHGNDLVDDDVELLGRRRACVVYCHGTHAHFGRLPHRWLDLRAAGVTMAVGTDSAASNTGVDLLADLRRLASARPDIPPRLLVEAATRGGRRALGWPDDAAVFAPGSEADGVLVTAPPEDVIAGRSEAVLAWLLGDGAAAVRFTVHRGREWRARGREAAGGGSPDGACDAPVARLDTPRPHG